MPPSKLSVVVPCFNEKDGLPRLEAELYPELEKLKVPFEVVLVDDGSKDGTAEGLRALALKRPDTVVLEHPQNLGLGAAVRTGIEGSTGDWIAVLDADLTFHPRQLGALLQAQERTGADCVSGSPFMDGARTDVPARRLWPSRAINGFYRLALGAKLTSFTPIFRLYRAKPLKELPLSTSGFEINTEILAFFLRKGLKVVEVPVELTTREHGASKLRPLPELIRHFFLALKLLLRR